MQKRYILIVIVLSIIHAGEASGKYPTIDAAAVAKASEIVSLNHETLGEITRIQHAIDLLHTAIGLAGMPQGFDISRFMDIGRHYTTTDPILFFKRYAINLDDITVDYSTAEKGLETTKQIYYAPEEKDNASYHQVVTKRRQDSFYGSGIEAFTSANRMKDAMQSSAEVIAELAKDIGDTTDVRSDLLVANKISLQLYQEQLRQTELLSHLVLMESARIIKDDPMMTRAQ